MGNLDEETAKKLCSQKKPENYCFYNKENYSGCNIINRYIRKQEEKGLPILEN